MNIEHEKVSISDARKDLSKLIHGFEARPRKIIELDRREHPTALLVSYDQYSPVIDAIHSNNLKALLVNFIASRWLGTNKVPDHLLKPQIEELNSLELNELHILSDVEPVSSISSFSELEHLNKRVIERLIKRHITAKAISDAEVNNLYEVSEHLSMNSTNE